MANPQTANYPASLTDSMLPPAQNNFSTTLTASCGSGDLTMTVAAIPTVTPCLVTIDSEIILVASAAGSTLTITTRGFNGTTGAAHANGATVSGFMTAYHLNQLYAEMKAVANKSVTPYAACSASLSGANQTITTSAGLTSYTDLLFAGEWYDYGSMHSTSVNTDRITVPYAGLYLVIGCVTWAASAVGSRAASITVNAAVAQPKGADVRFAASANTTDQTVSTVVYLAANDIVRLSVSQSSGGNLDVTGSGLTSLTVIRL